MWSWDLHEKDLLPGNAPRVALSLQEKEVHNGKSIGLPEAGKSQGLALLWLTFQHVELATCPFCAQASEYRQNILL